MLRRMPYPVFDDVIHEPHRLRICAMLVPSAGTEFATVRDEIGLSDSALSKHLKALSTRGYTRLERAVRDGRQVTTVVLTPAGPGGAVRARGRAAADGPDRRQRPPRRATLPLTPIGDPGDSTSTEGRASGRPAGQLRPNRSIVAPW